MLVAINTCTPSTPPPPQISVNASHHPQWHPIRQSIPAIRDRAVIEAKSAAVKVIVQLIRILLEAIADLDKRIEEAAAAHPDC